MTLVIRCLALAGLVTAMGCTPDPMAEPVVAPAPTPVPPPVDLPAAPAQDPQARAQAAMAAFGSRLRVELGEAIERDGPLGAIDFCKLEAPRIADQVSAGHGVRLGRVAVEGRHRNPANVASGWQAIALSEFQAAVANGAAPEQQVKAVRDGLPDGVELRVARGIRVEPACLLCHGTSVAPELAARISERYPGDRATGFSEGELRGAIWAEVIRASEQAP